MSCGRGGELLDVGNRFLQGRVNHQRVAFSGHSRQDAPTQETSQILLFVDWESDKSSGMNSAITQFLMK